MSSNMYSCTCCGKLFTRKHEHNKHSYICEILRKSKREVICEEQEDSDVPSVKQLYRIILEMGKKINYLEKYVEENKILVQSHKQKLDLVAELNTSHIFSNPLLFDTWIKNIVVTDKDLELFFEDGVVSCYDAVLYNNLQAADSPIRCFNEKKNVLYVYLKHIDETTPTSKETTCWKKMYNEEFVFLLKNIHKKIFMQLCEWKKINNELIKKNDKMQELYNNNVIKLMEIVEFNKEHLISKIKSNLYKRNAISFSVQ